MTTNAVPSSILIFSLILFLVGAGCQHREQEAVEAKKLSVVTTLFPLYDFTKNIAGSKARVTLLMPPGVEAHSFEPKAGDVLKVNNADVFVFTGQYMEPWAYGLLRGVDKRELVVVDASKGITLEEGKQEHGDHKDEKGEKDRTGGSHAHGKIDPHIWLDLANAQKIVANILGALLTVDPDNKDFYRKNADAYITKLADLDARYKKGLFACKKNIFVHGGHFAFNYLAKRYNLRYISAYPGSPDTEPSPWQIISLKKKIRENHIQYVYYEELIAPRMANILAKETGARLLKLHGAHNISKEDFEKGVSFLSIMEENLKNLKVGLECQQ